MRPQSSDSVGFIYFCTDFPRIEIFFLWLDDFVKCVNNKTDRRNARESQKANQIKSNRVQFLRS